MATTTRRCPERRRPVALVGFAVLVCACRCCCLDEAADSGAEEMEAGSSCPPGQVPCGNSSSSCLPRRLHCDGFPDCREGEDEKDCTDLHGGLSAVLGVLLNWSAHNVSRTQDSSPRFSCNRTDVPKACYCDLHSKSRVFCQNSNLTQVPRAIPDVTRLTFTNNSMGILPSGAFYGYTNLTSLMIVNSITGIQPGAFRGLDMLRIMTIEKNNISHIEVNSFSGLLNLVWLTLKYNRLDVFDFDVLQDLRLLEILNMEGNGLKRIAKPFPELAYLTWLDLKRNQIEVIDADTFENLLNLEALILRENHLMDVHEEAFRYNTKMLEIDLAVNFLTFVRPGLFHGLRDLKKIDLSANAIKTLPVTLFHNLRSLNSLNLSGLEINNIEIRHFRHLPKLEFIYFKKFQYCSYAPYVRICAPKTDGLSSTEHLLVWPVLRLSVWVVALTTCAGNSVVLAWRLLSKKEDRVLSLFIRNLSVADFLMGVYLVTVGSLDVAFRDEYNKHAHQWMSSWHCTLCGLLAMVSCEVSVLILSLITVERYRCIKMVLIMGLYLSMFTIIREDRQHARPVTMKKQEDVVLALRFFFIVLTDCLCWIPIVIIKILALCEVRISENVYAWVVVFILPINSALNPVIYTLAAPTELRRRIERFSQRILKCHKQIECMLTSNRTPRSSVATQSLTGTDIASASTDCTSAGGSYHPMARQSIAAIHELSESSEADDTVL
ncbi:relaxin receptor 1 isoform X3 [Dermacentor albipictus]|uniref:relaxin receptor 1 isoform X3 n=1 Tax=Dermacentor albipictus TaxID=60249 RepID=UPI0038FCC7DB